MEDHGRTLTKVLLGKTDGRRKAGRPKLRWLDCAKNYLKKIGFKGWISVFICMDYHFEGGTV
jgi:hypothetical protein